MTTTCASLIERVRSPEDSAAWERFVRLYAPLVRRWGRQAGLDDEDAADLVQEVMASLVRSLPQFELDPSGGFRRWLKTVTLNKWRDWVRRRSLPQSTQSSDSFVEAAVPDHVDSLADADYRQYLIRRALVVMKRDFKPETWQACWEVAAVGRSVEEVARELGMTTGAVHAAKFRVLLRLRQELAGLLD